MQCCLSSPPYWLLRDYGVDGQIGLETTPEHYVRRLVAVFREVRRVLRKDGTLWLNLGDSHVGARCGGQGPGGQLAGRKVAQARANVTPEKRAPGLRPKELVGIPWMVAFALRADGWRLRCDVLWSKGSCMPESVQDRPTRSHEYVFLLTKSERYHYDAYAEREPTDRETSGNKERVLGEDLGVPGARGARGQRFPWTNDGQGSNLRTVWTINTQPSGIEHFATMPPRLAERCLKLGTSDGGCCARCGKPRKRLLERGPAALARQRAAGGDRQGGYQGEATKDYAAAGVQDPSAVKARILAGMVEVRTAGWAPQCRHEDAASVPCTVLDPFGGVGTTALVAQRLGLDSIMCELKPEYAAMAQARVKNEQPLFSDVRIQAATA